MPGTPTIRTFLRSDRDQVTALANAHVAAVIPGASISTATLLSQLEREPGEFIDDPWVIERVTLVAEQRQRIVAAAHLQRYSDSPGAPPGLRDIGGIRWLVSWPATTFWPDSGVAGAALVDACLAVLDSWNTRLSFADGTLPAPGVFGVPEQWPHVRSLLDDAGFASSGRSERVLMALVSDLPKVASTPGPRGVVARRVLGSSGTRISGMIGEQEIGMIELDTTLDAASQRSRHDGLADIGNLHVDKGYGKLLGNWLMAQARDWLELGGVTRVLAYLGTSEDDADPGQLKFLQQCGFRSVTTTVRDLTLKR